jgi:dCTP deaminase
MLLSNTDIEDLISKKLLVISEFKEDAIGPCSIDLRLDSKLVKYRTKSLDLKHFDKHNYDSVIISDEGFSLKPGDFYIGATFESIKIPNGYFGLVETKGNIARAGLQVHNTDGHIDPGTDGKITLEIKNNANHEVVIYPEMFFCQIFIFKMQSLSSKPYHGKYHQQQGPTLFIPDQS